MQGHRFGRGASYDSDVEVPVQFFQSTIAIELAVTGASCSRSGTSSHGSRTPRSATFPIRDFGSW